MDITGWLPWVRRRAEQARAAAEAAQDAERRAARCRLIEQARHERPVRSLADSPGAAPAPSVPVWPTHGRGR